jgi:hypothetical protein
MRPALALALLLPACLGRCGESWRSRPLHRDDSGSAGDTSATPDDTSGAPDDTSGSPDDTSETAGQDDTAPSQERASLDPERPGGWRQASFVFAQARMNADMQNDEWVRIGWLELDEGEQVEACGGTGPRARRSFHHWDHDGDYPEGDCDEDKKDGVDFARWDHSSVHVDECPGSGGWVNDDGSATSRAFLNDCPAHVTAGFGDEAERTTWEGHYQYDAEARTLTLRYDVNGNCKKEYYRDLTHDADGSLLAMVLDGDRTGDTSSTNRGIGATHGYAYGSSQDIATSAGFTEALEAVHDREMLEDAWRIREDRGGDPPLEHYQDDDELGFAPVACGAAVGYDHSCHDAEGDAPYLAECAAMDPMETAYLRFLVDPFPSRSSREHLYWAWHAAHDPNWTGCYHRGSHSMPLLQVLDTTGAFRGYVGIEIQRSAETNGSGGVPADAWQETDYKVFRWIERGYEELPS